MRVDVRAVLKQEPRDVQVAPVHCVAQRLVVAYVNIRAFEQKPSRGAVVIEVGGTPERVAVIPADGLGVEGDDGVERINVARVGCLAPLGEGAGVHVARVAVEGAGVRVVGVFFF